MLVVDSALTTWKISSLRALGLIAYLLKIRLECWFSLNCAVVQIRFYNRCGLHTLLWRSFHLIYDMLMAFCLRIVLQPAFTVHCI